MTPNTRNLLLAVVAVALFAAGGWMWWQRQSPSAPPMEQAPAATAPQAEPAGEASAAAASAAASAVAVAEPKSEAPPLATEGVGDALIALVGKEAALTLLQTDDFPRRIVATVDNLGRTHAAKSLWPVVPAQGRFSVIEKDGQTVIAPDNAARYKPLVTLAESVDTQQAVDLYVRMLPLLQKQYEELGYPNKRFHARLIEVIDQMLATPEVPEPIAVQLTEVKGPIPSAQPWVRYEYVDPALQSASAGQKILVRMGADDRHRLQARLSAFRKALASRAGAR